MYIYIVAELGIYVRGTRLKDKIGKKKSKKINQY